MTRAHATRFFRSMPGGQTAIVFAAVIAVGCVVAATVSLSTHTSFGTDRALLAGVTFGVAFLFLAVVLIARG